MSNQTFAAVALMFSACVPGTFGGATTLPVARPEPAPMVSPASPPTTRPSDAQIATAIKPIEDALVDLSWIKYNEQGGLKDASGGNSAALVTSGNACKVAVERALAMGVSPARPITASGNAGRESTTLGAAKLETCDRLIARGRAYDASVEAAQHASTDQITVPYKAAGIAGDKLELLVLHDGYGFQGLGGVALATPRQLAQASVIFERMTSEVDGRITLRRYKFKGNKKMDYSEQVFDQPPGLAAFR